MKKRTSNALEIMNKRFGQEPGYQEMVAEEYVQAKASQAVYDARKAAGLTQRQLAELVGTQQSVIARMEDGDYDGHSIAMLDRIARALDRRVEVRFVSVDDSENKPVAPSVDEICRAVVSQLLPHLRAEVRQAVAEAMPSPTRACL